MLRHAYLSMLRARAMENKLSSLYKAGKIVGGVYLGKGQEAVSACIGASLSAKKDFFAPLIRDQAGRTAFGEPLIDCARTYLGSSLGPMKGRDGNIHRGDPRGGMPAMISHLGAQLSVVSGMLMAHKLKSDLQGRVGATCLGDGATSTGAFHEGINLASVEKLPLVVIIADNQYAYSTPTASQYACVNLVEKARGYGISGYSVDGTDFLACAHVISQAVERAREGAGPQLVVAHLLRLCGHGEHDDGSYISAHSKSSHYNRDCIEVATAQLLEAQIIHLDEAQSWQQEAQILVQEAVTQAQQEAPPNPFHEKWSAYSTSFTAP
jgi:acetoin:2,6-dichlorophenolindophenol oxidoreductase subunit alpha